MYKASAAADPSVVLLASSFGGREDVVYVQVTLAYIAEGGGVSLGVTTETGNVRVGEGGGSFGYFCCSTGGELICAGRSRR